MAVQNYIEYKGVPLQQNPNFIDVLTPFLKEKYFTHILEIGTGEGGFTLFLRDVLPDAKIKTYDIMQRQHYDQLYKNNIDAKVGNIFSEEINNTNWNICYEQISVETVDALPEAKLMDIEARQFLNEPGRKLIICDGGNKVGEFKCLARFLKPGDFIMAHDYADTYDRFCTEIKGKFWDWCEIEEKYIASSVKENGLLQYNPYLFETVAWTCKYKPLL